MGNKILGLLEEVGGISEYEKTELLQHAREFSTQADYGCKSRIYQTTSSPVITTNILPPLGWKHVLIHLSILVHKRREY